LVAIKKVEMVDTACTSAADLFLMSWSFFYRPRKFFFMTGVHHEQGDQIGRFFA
jgi:hypothetical protein